VGAARYDDVADWYDSAVEGATHLDRCYSCDQIHRLDDGLPGLVVDLGCGTAAHRNAVARPDRTIVGVDISMGVLRHAQRRLHAVVVADATRVPLRVRAADVVVAIFVHTDVESAHDLFRSAHDLLRPGGTALFVGAHPCFNGPFFGRDPDGRFVTYPGYLSTGFFTESPAWGEGIRSRVGMHHVPLGEYLNAVIDSGLLVERWDEGGLDPPMLLGFRARKR
jgi:SAM-dependent methyltransferase